MKNPKVFFLIFALSGFSGLIYESIWTHYLKLFLGHAAYAQTLVLAIFMGGMALGSWICCRYSARWENLFIGYALAEGVIGVLALIFHNIFDQVIQFSYSTIIPGLGTPLAVNAFKWTLSSLLILPQSILLGMTFPLMSAAIIRMFPQKPGGTISMLYFTNSIGAAIGVLVSGFLLIKLVGLPGTIRIAGVINISLAIVVWFLTRDNKVEPSFEAVSYKLDGNYGSVGWYRLFLAASLITGTASFIYEIGWIRMLSLVLGSSTHAFELMLSAFVFGLAFGGLWVQRRIDYLDPVRFLFMVQIIMGLLALSTLPLYGNTFGVMQWILKTLSKTETGYALFNLSSHAIALTIMLPTTFCAGMTLPLITYSLIKQGYGEGSIGAVYAANTVGAIIGVFFAIHVGMPLLGLKGVIILGACLDIGLGLAILWSTKARYDSYRLPVLATTISICAVAATLLFVKLDPYKMASGVYRTGDLITQDKGRLIYHKDGKTATVSLTLDSQGGMSIRTNGKSDAGINISSIGKALPDEYTMTLLAVIPMAINPSARTVANIGLGSGLTTNTLLGNHLLKEVDTIEIEEKMVEAARYFGQRVELTFKDPRSKIHIDDAKTFFSAHNRKYDIIISEPSNPWVSGVSGLFSEEFYHRVNRHLSSDGLFVQWVQLYEIDLNLVASIFKAISSNFSDFVVYAPNYSDILIIAKKNGHVPAPSADLFKIPRLIYGLNRVDISSIQDIEIRKIGNKKRLGKLFETFPASANSDYYPFLDQNAARTRFMNANAQDLIVFAQEPLPVLELLMNKGLPRTVTNITPSPYLDKTVAAYTAMALRDYFLHGIFNPKYGEIPPDTKRDATQLKQIFYECGSVEGPNRRIFIFNSAKSMAPYLSPNELDSIWKSLESGQCSNSLSATEKNYISFFKEVGNRNAEAMANMAETLLQNEKDITPARLQYLVAAGMLGNISQGNKEESLRLWSFYKSKILNNGNPGFLFRLLVANSSSP